MHDIPFALLTGATRGIGRAIAQELASKGCPLLLNARSSPDLAALKAFLTAEHPGCRVRVLAADLQQRQGIQDLIGEARRSGPAPGLLINNVGIFEPGGLLTDPPGKLERMMQLNLYAAYHLVRALAPAMAERGSGHVFNICSVASRRGFADRGAYVITKHALLGLSRALRAELQPSGVRVTAILPGPTDTSSWTEDEKPEGKRLMPPEDVARMLWAAFQLSDAAVAEEIILQPQERLNG